MHPSKFLPKNKKMKKALFDDNEEFYVNSDGYQVFTAEYLMKRGYCCGNGCLHCPYQYKNVEDPNRREKLIQRQKELINKNGK